MRKHWLIAALCLLAGLAHAEEMTLLSGKIQHGGYGAPVMKITTIDGRSSVLIGAQGAWILSHTFALGAGGFGLVSPPEYTLPTEPAATPYMRLVRRHLEFGYGGIFLSYIAHSDRLFHPVFDVMIGGGSLSLVEGDYNDDNTHDGNTDNFMVVEPTVNAELNIVSFMRLTAGVGYRWCSGVSRFGYSTSDVNGLTGSVALKFGKF